MSLHRFAPESSEAMEAFAGRIVPGPFTKRLARAMHSRFVLSLDGESFRRLYDDVAEAERVEDLTLESRRLLQRALNEIEGKAWGPREERLHPREHGRFAEKPDVAELPELDVEDLADMLVKRAKENDVRITKRLKDVVKRSGGGMEGLEFRLKTRDRTLDKINRKKAKMPGASTEQIARSAGGDGLRYTATFPPDQHAAGIRAVLADLEAQGFQVEQMKNYWEPGQPYHGINGIMVNPQTGFRFELQFHTPDSWTNKQRAHDVYQHFQESGDPHERHTLYNHMVTMAAKLETPAGVMEIGTPSRQGVPGGVPRTGIGSRAEQRAGAISTPQARRSVTAPEVRIGSVEDLEVIDIPDDVVAQIRDLGLDEPLAARKKGETAQRLLGEFEDTRQLHTDPETGSYSQQRLDEVHDPLIDLFLREKKPVWNGKFVEWVPDPNGEQITTPDKLRARLEQRLAELQAGKAVADPDNEGMYHIVSRESIAPDYLGKLEETPLGDASDYFKPFPDAVMISASDLTPQKKDPPEKLARARQHIEAAKAGIADKRKPLDVVPDPDNPGKYVVVDGKSTYGVLGDLGLKEFPVIVHEPGWTEPTSGKDEIVAALQAELDNLSDEGGPRAMFLAGGNASGKSTALYSPENAGLMRPGMTNVEINFDLIKERMPEFAAMAAAHDIYGTDGTHFESADIANRLLQEAQDRGVNVIIDASGNSQSATFAKQIQKHKELGYRTDVLMVDAPIDVALRDSVKRAMKTGRYVPAPILRRVHRNSVANHMDWRDKDYVDNWQVYRRDDNGVIKVADGGAGQVNVIDQAGYDAVTSKASGAAGRLPETPAGSAETGKAWTPERATQHPRYPRGTPGGLGGKFRPKVHVHGVTLVDDVSVPNQPPLKPETLYQIKRLGLDRPLHEIPKGPRAQEVLGDKRNTEEMYLINGEWKRGRAELHERILAEIFAGHEPKPEGQRVALFTAGGTASGKSSATRADPSLLPPDAVIIDADFFKARLPEYGHMIGGDPPDPYAAAAVHAESSYLASLAAKRAFQQGYNVKIDGTGDKGPGKFIGKLQQADGFGYRVEVLMVDLPTNEAIERMMFRASPQGEEPGRYVPIVAMKDAHRHSIERMREWMSKKYVARWTVYRNTEKPPILVASGGGGGPMQVHNEVELRAIVEKPNEEGTR